MHAKSVPIPDEHKYAGLDIETMQADGTFSSCASLFGRVDLGHDAVVRSVSSAAAQWVYEAAQRAGDFPGTAGPIHFTVRQISAQAGPGNPASIAVTV